MAHDIMGKIVRYDKPALIIVIFLIFLLLTAMRGYASYSEYDLLQKGYESYLSYQPEKAAEVFRTFLQEFPDSSARDAALFWLGKSLMQAKSADEAGHVFKELKQQFPDSPFVAFIVPQSESSESEKPTAIRETEPVRKTDETITAPTIMTETAATSETPSEKESEAAQSSMAIQQQMSETLSSERSETVSAENIEDREPILSESETALADTVMATKDEPVVKESEVKEPAVKEPEVKEPAQLPEPQGTGEETGKQAVYEEQKLPAIPEQAQSDSAGEVLPEGGPPILADKADEPPGENIKSAQEPNEAAEEQASQLSGTPDKQEIDAQVLVTSDVALPGIVPLDAVPEPETIKTPETAGAITILGDQEAVSPLPELSPDQESDSVKKVEDPGGKESEVQEPVAKEPEVKEPEVKEPAQLQEDQATGEESGLQAVEGLNELPLETGQQAQPVGTGDVLPNEETPVLGDTIRQDDKQVKTGELSPQGPSESNTMTLAQTVLNKVGIQGAIIWSTGDRNQDFIDEQILYNEAVKLNFSVDEDELNELHEQYTLGIEEVDYLKRFLLICKLIEKKAKELPGDKRVEVMSVRYNAAGQRERPELAAELQASANKGDTFEDISRLYPDVVQFQTVTVPELPEWIQERIQGLQNYEVGVIWSEEGYMILKPIIQLYSYDPFEEMSSEKREKITANIRSWITELKGANPGDPVSK
jgi:hypothetical protein